MTNLSDISFLDLVERTRPQNVSDPALSDDNRSVDNPGDHVATYVETTAQALSRFYNGLYLIRQSFADQMHLPETIGLMTVAIKQNLIKPLSNEFPEFADFEFELTDRGTIVGISDTANTILYALQQVAMAPVDEHTAETLPQHKQVLDDMAAAQARDVYDFDLDDEDDEDWDNF